MIKMKFLSLSILTFSCFLSFGQKLHHQMITAQGGTFVAKNGLIVRQSIGQMSAIGNASVGSIILQQGFQQSLFTQSFAVPTFNLNTIGTTVYPNPFNGPLTVVFSAPITNDLSVSLFNMTGLSLYTKSFTTPQSVLNFNFDTLPAGSYILRITARNYSFSKIIIKF
jgi:hypothetical protein